MVHLTSTNDFIVLEGDEYLSSPIDRRPKFHLYQPNIALISGIAWDHINVFPTYENYVEQFKIFVNQITNGGILVYNEEDLEVKNIAETTANPIRKLAYQTPIYHIDNGITYLETPEGPMPISVFGAHNLNNLAGAKWICQNMGVDEADFYEAIATFKGASKRLEKIAANKNAVAYKDFAHSPSKVAATTKAVKNQYPNKTLIACLELHTYSSLNANFLEEYQGALDAADVAVVYYSPEALKIKQLDDVTYEQIAAAFQREDLIIYTNPEAFKDYLFSQSYDDKVLLLMSSGNYGGLDFEMLKSKFG
jgi:UDP-N-acetylmuramate: L-alanyl-gamma-D-glutamyl-meso-diaminopimelate ligase